MNGKHICQGVQKKIYQAHCMTASKVRVKVAWRSLEELGLSMAEIARHLGENTSSITRAIGNLEKNRGDSYAS